MLYHLGSKNIDYLAKLSNKEKRDGLVDEWYKDFVARSLYQMMNSIGQQSNKYKMKLIFLAKMQSDRVKAILDNVNGFAL